MNDTFFLGKNIPIKFEELINFKKNIKLYTPLQISWLSGYLWGLINKKKKITKKKITIISASQTGNARNISEKLYNRLFKKNIKSNLINAKEYNFKKISEEDILILITSTHGNGEPPEEALPLYNFLHSKRAPILKKLEYSIFGLGDTSYEKFCQSAKDFDKKFLSLGAKKILKRIDADIEYEEISNNWIKEIVNKLKNNITNNNKINNFKKQKEIILYSKEKPFKAQIIIKKKITGCYSYKNIQHIEIDLLNSGIKYEPGDVVGIIHKNDPQLVKEIIKLLNFNPNEKVKIKNNTITLKEALINNYELLNNTTNLIKKYAKISSSLKLLNLLKRNNEIIKYAKNTPFIEMLYEEPIKIESKKFLEILRPLKPRLYSISSSQLENKNELHITVNVVKYKINNHKRYGSASSYLAYRLNENEYINIFIQKNKNFKLPKNNKSPIIMIAAGTGIAPFRAFLQQRDNENAKGKNWLFFGNQHFTEDFIYQAELQKYYEKKILTKINLAWSRDQKEKIYIQNKIYENGFKFWEWIKKGSYIYVCGDANSMAKDVENTIIDIISKYGKMDYEKSNKFLINMRLKGYYQRDIY